MRLLPLSVFIGFTATTAFLVFGWLGIGIWMVLSVASAYVLTTSLPPRPVPSDRLELPTPDQRAHLDAIRELNDPEWWEAEGYLHTAALLRSVRVRSHFTCPGCREIGTATTEGSVLPRGHRLALGPYTPNSADYVTFVCPKTGGTVVVKVGPR